MKKNRKTSQEKKPKGAEPDTIQDETTEEPVPEDTVEPDEIIEEEVLGSIEVEEGQENLFFTLEQQKIDLLEHLLINVEESKRSVYLMKKMYNIIQRFKEMKTSYTSFEDGVKILKLPSDQYHESFIKNNNPLFVPVSDKVKIKFLDLGDVEYIKSYYYKLNDLNEFIFKDPSLKKCALCRISKGSIKALWFSCVGDKL